MTKIAVFGNRSISDSKIVLKEFSKWIKNNKLEKPLVFLHGGAAGPQTILKEFGEGTGAWVNIVFKPWTMIWSKLEFKPIYFYLRNKQIIENADKIIVFDNGEHDSEVYRVIDLCQKKNKDLTVIKVE